MKQHNTAQGAVKDIYVKAALMGAAFLLLLLAMIFFTTAWYTKMVSTAGIDLQAAQWEFTANHTVDKVEVRVYEYDSLSEGRAAPGSGGWIPITLGAHQSHTDIEFRLTMDRSTMSEEFQDRIFFYYYELDENGSPVKDANGKSTPIYFEISPTGEENPDAVMTGIVPKNSAKVVNIYWEWIYEAPASVTDEEAREAWDEFDTKVGQNPELYMPDMKATVSVVGVEVNPETTRKAN